MPQKYIPMNSHFHIDNLMPGWDANNPHGGFVDATPYSKAERKMLTAGFKAEDRDKARETGEWRCLVCGSRHDRRYKAVACCEGLTPGLSDHHEGRSVHCGEMKARAK